jgi:hypothetical protein
MDFTAGPYAQSRCCLWRGRWQALDHCRGIPTPGSAGTTRDPAPRKPSVTSPCRLTPSALCSAFSTTRSAQPLRTIFHGRELWRRTENECERTFQHGVVFAVRAEENVLIFHISIPSRANLEGTVRYCTPTRGSSESRRDALVIAGRGGVRSPCGLVCSSSRSGDRGWTHPLGIAPHRAFQCLGQTAPAPWSP